MTDPGDYYREKQAEADRLVLRLRDELGVFHRYVYGDATTEAIVQQARHIALLKQQLERARNVGD